MCFGVYIGFVHGLLVETCEFLCVTACRLLLGVLCCEDVVVCWFFVWCFMGGLGKICFVLMCLCCMFSADLAFGWFCRLAVGFSFAWLGLTDWRYVMFVKPAE